MSGGGSLIAIIAAQAAAERAKLLQQFRVADATKAERAQTLGTLGISASSSLDLLKKQGVIGEASGGRFYLDEPKLAELSTRQPNAAMTATMIALAILGVILLALLFQISD